MLHLVCNFKATQQHLHHFTQALTVLLRQILDCMGPGSCGTIRPWGVLRIKGSRAATSIPDGPVGFMLSLEDTSFPGTRQSSLCLLPELPHLQVVAVIAEVDSKNTAMLVFSNTLGCSQVHSTPHLFLTCICVLARLTLCPWPI